jgi:hypothetical protein
MALLITKHPELKTLDFGIDDLWPILSRPRWKRSLWRRTRAAIFGGPPIRAILYQSLVWLDKHRRLPRLTSVIFWRLVAGCRRVGFLEGLQLYGSAQVEQ